VRASAATSSGRPVSKETQEMYQFCYEQYVTNGKKLSVVFALCKQRFQARAPKDESQVSTYAKRYAARNGLPWRPKSSP
jgi:hypothetical protein